MSYADRLNSFNQAVSTANEHVRNMRDTLSNPELRENPVRFGLDAAGQVLGTGEGLIRLRSSMKSDDVLRNTQSAFFDRLGELKQAHKSLSNSIGSNIRESLQNVSGRGSQSSASAVADNQPARLVQSSSTIAENRSVPPPKTDPSNADLQAEDGGISQRLQNYPQSVIQDVDEANEINRSINRKVSSGLNGDEISELNSKLKGSLGDFNAISDLPPGGAKTTALKNFLTSKNNIANDVLARKSQNLAPAKGYDTTGTPFGEESSVVGTKQGMPQSASNVAQADSSGVASAGSNASQTVAQSANQNNIAQSVGSADGGDASNLGAGATQRVVANASGDIQDAGQSVSATVDDGANILSRGRALGLVKSLVPGQGGGNVPGLSTEGTNAGDSTMVSALQHLNASQSQLAQASGSQTANASQSLIGGNAGTRQAQASQSGADADADASTTGARQASINTASQASQTADEGGASAGRGLAQALGTEETLDALAPDTGPLAPILEAGSLLATLGTSIASIFEPETEKSSAPSPPPVDKAVGGFSVGANLKQDATGSVGAF